MDLLIGFLLGIITSHTINVESVKEIFHRLSDQNKADMMLGLDVQEADDFSKVISEFATAVTLSDYIIEEKGWINIKYEISGRKVPDEERTVMKKAIVLELHNYLIRNHGVDMRSFFVSTITETTVVIRMAASKLAQEEFERLDFRVKEFHEENIIED